MTGDKQTFDSGEFRYTVKPHGDVWVGEKALSAEPDGSSVVVIVADTPVYAMKRCQTDAGVE